MKPARRDASLSASLALGGCSGVFESDLAAPQAYVLRLPPATAPAPAGAARQRARAAPRGGPWPRFGTHRAVAQRAALRLLRRQPLGRAGSHPRREPDDRRDARQRHVFRGVRRLGAIRAALQPAVRAAAFRSRLHEGRRARRRYSSRSTARSDGIATASCSRASPRKDRPWQREDRLNAVVGRLRSGDRRGHDGARARGDGSRGPGSGRLRR